MSLALLGKIVEDEEISDPIEFTVLVALADATNKETMLCYPSLSRIAQVARCTRRGAINALSRLARKGWIQIIRRKKPGSKEHLANTYRIIKYGDVVNAVHQGSEPNVKNLVNPVHYVVNETQIGSEPGSPKPVREPIREESAAAAASFALSSEPEQKQKKAPGRKPADFAEFLRYCEAKGISKDDAEGLYDQFEANGWTLRTGKAISDWQRHVNTYKRKGWLDSIQNPKRNQNKKPKF